MSLFTVLWALPWVRKLALGVGIALAVALLALTIFMKGRAAGKLAAQIDAMTKSLAAERRMKDASAGSPTNADDLARRMRDHKF